MYGKILKKTGNFQNFLFLEGTLPMKHLTGTAFFRRPRVVYVHDGPYPGQKIKGKRHFRFECTPKSPHIGSNSTKRVDSLVFCNEVVDDFFFDPV